MAACPMKLLVGSDLDAARGVPQQLPIPVGAVVRVDLTHDIHHECDGRWGILELALPEGPFDARGDRSDNRWPQSRNRLSVLANSASRAGITSPAVLARPASVGPSRWC